ncbi:hypothetical protein [Actinoplanes sp. ATCC 53533]|uniref:hypothetical protein n=1 Tax=Actinoplanes sp. ATCC 53533 TaxID=1288362 RepID=UPI000F78ED7E|nr:hypothetical protein [Actinoplanes sp. ATCC 53533]
MSYPPPEGFPPPTTTPTAPQPPANQHTMGFPVQSPAAPAYPPSLAQTSGFPYQATETRRRPAVLVLAIAAALLLVFGGLMLGLYVNDHGNLNDTKADLRDTRADLGAQVQEQKSIVTQEQAKFAEAEKRATDLETQLKTSKANLADVTAQRDALVPCMRRIQDAFDSAANGDARGIDTALKRARTSCDKAEIKVDS